MNYKKYLAAVVFVLLLLSAGGAAMLWFLPHTIKWKITEGEKPLSNPLKGWACWGENLSAGEGLTLAYVPVYWNEVETEEGVFDFRSLEKNWHFAQWREQGVRLILRVVADSPSEERSMKIPQWLYDAMDGDGAWYENDYGKGFSPNYENSVLKKAHAALLDALGEQYNADPQIAYIQLGSLGHWGEWHVNQASGITQFPDSTVTDGYVRDYLRAFPDKKLLMRRPYAIVSKEGIGLYDDTFGEPREHEEWMNWIQNGYVSAQNGQELSGAPEFWKKGPSGGEIASNRDISWYFEDSFENTLSFIRESHTTYLGPHIPREKELSAKSWENACICQREMGYCFTIKEGSVKYQRGKDLRLSVLWKNIGLAPFYENWDIRFTLKDKDNAVVWSSDFPAKLSQWGDETKFSAVLAGTENISADGLSVWAGIVDPMTGNCGVNLAVELEEKEGLFCLGKIEI